MSRLYDTLSDLGEDHMQSSFAEVLNEIRSERSGGVDLAPVLTSLKETQEMTQGLNDSLQAGRSTSGEPSTGILGTRKSRKRDGNSHGNSRKFNEKQALHLISSASCRISGLWSGRSFSE